MVLGVLIPSSSSLLYWVQIKEVRRATRQEKKRRAMAMRAKELGSLGMQVNEKGQVIVAKSSSLVKEIETELVEEVGLKCCICMEGYRNQPNKVWKGDRLKSLLS